MTLKTIGWLGVAVVYLLTLATQLPHIHDTYSALERQEHALFGIDTAWGAAIAFEATVAVFTLRRIINRKAERSRWTGPGLAGFIAISALANLSYYFDIAAVDNVVMPGALVVAIPLALWLYAEEFSATTKAMVRKAARESAKEAQDDAPVTYPCKGCGRTFDTQQGLSAHMRWCKGE